MTNGKSQKVLHHRSLQLQKVMDSRMPVTLNLSGKEYSGGILSRLTAKDVEGKSMLYAGFYYYSEGTEIFLPLKRISVDVPEARVYLRSNDKELKEVVRESVLAGACG